MRFSDFVYEQYSGFAKAGKKLQPAKNDAEKTISKLIALGLLLMAVAAGYFASTFGNIAWNIKARAWLLCLALLAFAGAFYKGVSISWIINGLLKYWFAVLVLLFVFVMVIYIFVEAVFGDIGEYELPLLAGTLMFVMASLFVIAYARGAKKSTTSLQKFGAYLMVLVWVAFLLGGLFGIAYGIGLADWFFEDVLGW